MKHKILLLLAVVVFIAGFGAFLNLHISPLDAVTGASPKAKKAAQASAQLEGEYIFGINPSIPGWSEESAREGLKVFVSGQTDTIGLPPDLSVRIYVSETDYALAGYADSLCDRLRQAGIDAQTKHYGSTMFRSRILSGRYSVFLIKKDLIPEEALNDADYIILDSSEMR